MTMPVDDLICPECGYDLRAIESERCPECGQALDRDALRRSSIPWSHRHEIGRLRAYWRTVTLAIRRPSVIAAEITRPVDLDDALKFRRVTALVAAVVPMAAVVWLYVASLGVGGAPSFGGMFGWPRTVPPDAPPPALYTLGWALESALVAAVCAAIWLFFFAAAGAASYFFHPQGLPMTRQNRAVALSYYACAPLALTPATLSLIITVAVAMKGGWFMRKALVLPLSIVMTLMVVSLALQAIATFVSPLRMLARSTHCTAARVLALAVALPVMWAVLGVIILMGIPAAVGFVSLVVLSLAS